MQLKELDVQGYKSFATKHRFVFPSGVTAIVGPNGSGKSNIADAIRWVLGEQRTSQLRARRTDDMIFAGTEKRPRAGLAEVSIVLDNSDGWIEVDFSEVRVSRRAHRDGTNEYFINGARVLLREVLDLLGARLGGGTYTVIGQGLVDSALSLRPDERRALIDEAAGIVPLQRKRDRALRQLEETAANLTRVKDILAEITPRLRRMERLAERAERHDELAAQLEQALRLWYGYQWHRALDAHSAGQANATTLEAEAATLRAEVESRSAALRNAEEAVEALQAEMTELRQRRDAVLSDAAGASEGSAVAKARLEGLEERRRERESAALDAEAEVERLAGRVGDLMTELDAAEAAHAELEAVAKAAREALTAAEAAREDVLAELETARRAALQTEADLQSRRERLDSLGSAVASRSEDSARLEAEAASLVSDLEAAARERSAAEERLAEAEARLAATEADISELESRLERTTVEAREARDAHARAATAHSNLQSRLDALEALFAETEESDAARAVRTAGAIRILGTVAGLVDVAPEWESAVAAALGGRVYGLVVDDQAALDHALRALPADVRGQVALVPAAGPSTVSRADVNGALRAADVASCPSAPDVLERLLGDVAFVEDVAAARAVISETTGIAAAATRDGRLVLASGVVLAGAPARDVLALERERRKMPAALAAASDRVRETANEADRLTALVQSLEARLGDLGAARTEADGHRRAANADLDAKRAAADRIQRDIEWRRDSVVRLTTELDGLAMDRQAAETKIAALVDLGEARGAEVDSIARKLETIDLSGPRGAAQDAAQAALEAAAKRAGARAMRDAAVRDLEAAENAVRMHRLEAERLESERTALIERSTTLAGKASERQGELQSLDAAIAPLEERQQESTRGLRERAGELEETRRRLREAEQRVAESRVNHARTESRVERLFEQMVADREWLPELADLPESYEPSQAVSLPAVDELPDDNEDRIARLRRELRAIGSIDLEALATFRETVEHHHSLTEQKADLEAASADLHEALAALEDEMSGKFDETFQTVATEFAKFFPRLFGGGEAELVIDTEVDGPAGIDILARPPGKRQQPLALLSGGERALTAVALVFALLKASETPFVVLDEVDAALDEANINRFRDALADLAERTQIVIITHNRGTVQTADTVYGVSMAEDGASQIVSLRVEEMVRT